MDLSIRDWLLVIGVLLLLAVALDGYRRARRERRNQVRLSRNAKRSAKNFKHEQHVSEIYNGGARVVVENAEGTDGGNKRGSKTETGPDELKSSKEETYKVDPLFADPFEQESDLPAFDVIGDEPLTHKAPADHVQAPDPVKPPDNKPPEEIIWLNVMASNQQNLDAGKLHKILQACDCRYHSSGVFYRFEKEDGQGDVQFSIVNMIEPGTFADESLNNLQTPGVSFLLRLPGPGSPVEALNCMIETAQCIARNLNATIKDENLSSVTDQRLEHHRQQIRDFLKRKLLAIES